MTRAQGLSAAAVQALPAAGTDPDRPAVVCDSGEMLTYGQLAARASRLGGYLRDQGLAVGDVVAVVAENSPRYFEMLWACRMAGLYYAAVNSHLGAAEVAFIVNDCGASALLASNALPVTAELTPELVPNARIRLLLNGSRPDWDSYDAAVETGPDLDEHCEVEGDLLQYSSGTTGRPKGIRRPLRAAPKSAAEDRQTFIAGLIGVDSGSVYLCPAPMYHSAPNIWTMAVLRLGATVVLMQKFDAEKALELIERHRVTHGQFVPTMFTRMLKLPAASREKTDVSTLRGVVHAAAPCPVGVKRSMIEWWGPIVYEYWSSSEGAGFTFLSSPEWLEHPGSVGRPLLNPLHICDAEGNELPVGESGAIWAEGATFSYLNDPDKNAETTSPQGWRTVGDIGRFDADGYLYLTDRASFMIISGGVNIYPQEAENVLIEHPRVLDAAVVGVPDEDLGEIAVAVVQCVDPAEAGDAFAAELGAWCTARLARYKCPRRIQFTDALPRSETGKLVKRRLREQLVRQANAVDEGARG